MSNLQAEFGKHLQGQLEASLERLCDPIVDVTHQPQCSVVWHRDAIAAFPKPDSSGTLEQLFHFTQVSS